MIPFKHYVCSLLGCLLLISSSLHAEVVETLRSGDASIRVETTEDNRYNLSFYLGEREIPSLSPGNPMTIEVNSLEYSGLYNSYSLSGKKLICKGVVESRRKSLFAFTDTYIAKEKGIFELQRSLEVTEVKNGDTYFLSLFGFITDEQATKTTKNEYFIPGVWYKGNFTPDGNLPAGIPEANDTYFMYREDRITMPLVMFRSPSDKLTVSLIHKDSKCETVVSDSENLFICKDYQYSSVGIKREDNVVYTTLAYPGSEYDRRAGRGHRWHPVEMGLKQEYHVEFCFSATADYAEAVEQTWNRAYELYDPTIYPVDLQESYEGLIETLQTYYVPNREMGGIRDAPGFPFQVTLTDFQPLGIDYQMGFVGMQIATGYYLFREGIEKKDDLTKEKGKAVLDFWAKSCLTKLGFPRTWYDPGLNGNTGRFRSGSDIRVCTGGMEGLIAAWCFAKRNGVEIPQWIDSCIRFGDWLVANQNKDGSYYYSYDQNVIVSDKHPLSHANKYLTICAVRYLVELYIATGNEAYKTAALRAGEFCLERIHSRYMYVACVVDNPKTIDSESGQMALNGFLSLYDLTKEKRWLDAAEQAAIYTESWVYMFEIPVEKDRTGATAFPRDRSIVGQHLIAIGHSAADLGFAWSSFAFYRLYLATGNEHYLQTARISAHNTKQSMNWDGSLFPGQPKGLQLEAFQVMIPRRKDGIMTTLNWNYAAHLDPMFRFKDAFGTPDMEEVEKIPFDERKRMAERYSQVQSADWGQEVDPSSITDIHSQNELSISPNPAVRGEPVRITHTEELSSGALSVYGLDGKLYVEQQIDTPCEEMVVATDRLPQGHYIIQLQGIKQRESNKLIIK
ncbi:T9SS type A sorting domain-containing protein [Parabacteroides sp. OttesenSCG-928-N08]|nr:T9SS type A sorting domain-containing protein [Parabacteroides sp. OttesenSCG-928-N08]